MNRRGFVQHALAAAAVAGCARKIAGAEGGPRAAAATTGMLVDTHVYLSRWPFRALALDDTPRLVDFLARHGVGSAWAASFDAVFHRDIAAVNARLAAECARDGRGILVPMGAVNPTLPDWEEDVRRCHEVHRMPGIRLHPNYHGYNLDDPSFAQLLDLATERGLIVQLAVLLEDRRTQHPLVQVAPVHVEPLVQLLATRPQARIVLLNSMTLPQVLLRRLAALPQVYFDIANVEAVAGIEQQLAAVRGIQLVFGSHAPFFIFESAAAKLRESILSATELAAIGSGRALRMI